MKLHPLLCVAAPTLLLFGTIGLSSGWAQDSQAQEDGAWGGKLLRVRPSDEAALEASDELDEERIASLLTSQDLAQREKNFDGIVARARHNDELRTMLETLSEDTSRPDLAWTARLARRELDRLCIPLLPANRLNQSLRLGDRHLSSMDQFFLQNRVPVQVFTPQHGLWSPKRMGGQGTSSGRSVNIRGTADGFEIRIKESEDGEDAAERVYRGETLEQIFEEHPELKDEIGMSAKGLPGGFAIDVGIPGSQVFEWQKLFEPFENDVRRPQPFGARLKLFETPQAASRPVQTDVLGVRPGPVSKEHAKFLGLEEGYGVQVDSTLPGTIAHIFGVGSGDVLLELNGRPLRDGDDITAAMAEVGPGDPVELIWADTLGQKHKRVWRSDEAADTAKPKGKF